MTERIRHVDLPEIGSVWLRKNYEDDHEPVEVRERVTGHDGTQWVVIEWKCGLLYTCPAADLMRSWEPKCR